MWKELGRDATFVAGHQKELDERKECLAVWNTRKTSAAKKAPPPVTGGAC